MAAAAAGRAAQNPSSPAAAAVAEAVLSGSPIPPADQLTSLPRGVQAHAEEYRQRERTFHSALTPPRGATDVELELFEKRGAIERVVYCLFSRREVARIAAAYASDADVSVRWDGTSDLPRREAAFIDDLLRTAAQPWLAPYLNLTAGYRKLCASRLEGPESAFDRKVMETDARRQLTRARDAGPALIRAAADYLMASDAPTAARLCNPSP